MLSASGMDKWFQKVHGPIGTREKILWVCVHVHLSGKEVHSLYEILKGSHLFFTLPQSGFCLQSGFCPSDTTETFITKVNGFPFPSSIKVTGDLYLTYSFQLLYLISWHSIQYILIFETLSICIFFFLNFILFLNFT